MLCVVLGVCECTCVYLCVPIREYMFVFVNTVCVFCGREREKGACGESFGLCVFCFGPKYEMWKYF